MNNNPQSPSLSGPHLKRFPSLVLPTKEGPKRGPTPAFNYAKQGPVVNPGPQQQGHPQPGHSQPPQQPQQQPQPSQVSSGGVPGGGGGQQVARPTDGRATASPHRRPSGGPPGGARTGGVGGGGGLPSPLAPSSSSSASASPPISNTGAFGAAVASAGAASPTLSPSTNKISSPLLGTPLPSSSLPTVPSASSTKSNEIEKEQKQPDTQTQTEKESEKEKEKEKDKDKEKEISTFEWPAYTGPSSLTVEEVEELIQQQQGELWKWIEKAVELKVEQLLPARLEQEKKLIRQELIALGVKVV
jgi:hypothetical protein